MTDQPTDQLKRPISQSINQSFDLKLFSNTMLTILYHNCHFSPWFDEGNACIYSLLLNKEQLAAGLAVLPCSSVSLVCVVWGGSYIIRPV